MQEVFRYKQLASTRTAAPTASSSDRRAPDVHQPARSEGVKLPSNMFAERV